MNLRVLAPACASCASPSVTTRTHDETLVPTIEGRRLHLRVPVPRHTCADCGLEFTDVEAEDRQFAAALGPVPGPEPDPGVPIAN